MQTVKSCWTVLTPETQRRWNIAENACHKNFSKFLCEQEHRDRCARMYTNTTCCQSGTDSHI